MAGFDPYGDDGSFDEQWDERMQSLSSLEGDHDLYMTFILGLDFTTPEWVTVDNIEEDAPGAFREHWELEYEISDVSVLFEEEPTEEPDSEDGEVKLAWSGELHLTIVVDDDSEEARNAILDAILDIKLPHDVTISRID